MDLEVWKKYQRKTIDRMYSIRGRDKEKILEELRQKHQRKDVDKIVVTHEEHQPPQTQPEISIKENVH